MATLFTTIAAGIGKAVSTIGTIAPAVSAAGTIAGGLAQASAMRQQARAQQANLDFQAEQLEMKGKEEQAAAQQQAFQLRRQKELALSSLQARSAGSGFAADDPATLQIGSEIAKYGTLQEMMAAFGGRSRRAGLEDEASGRRAAGVAGVQGARSAATGTILGGLSQGFARFAQSPGLSRPTGFRYG